MKQRTKQGIFKTVVCLLCVTTIALCGVFLPRGATFYVSVSALAVVAVFFAVVDAEKNPHASRIALVAAVIALVAVAVYMLYITTGLNERFTDFEALKSFIVDSGYWGYAVFIGLTVFQVVVLPIPQAVTIILGVAIYGATVSFILSVIGTMIGSLISFALGKIFGRRICDWMFGKENTQKYAEILGEKGRFIFIIMLLFPAFPDDMLCMIAGITNMTYAYFTVVCALTRPVMIGLTAYLGSGVIPFAGWGIAVWIAIACALFVSFVLVSGVKTRIESKKKGIR